MMLLVLPVSEAWGQSNEQARLEAEREALAKRIRETQQMLDQTRSERKESTREWAVLQEQLDLRQELLANLRAERRAAERQLGRRQNGAREADAQLRALKDEYADMMRRAAGGNSTNGGWPFSMRRGCLKPFAGWPCWKNTAGCAALKPTASPKAPRPCGKK